MQRVSSLIDMRDDDFRANDLHNRRLASELKERQKAARHVRPRSATGSGFVVRTRCSFVTASKPCSTQERLSWSCQLWRAIWPMTARFQERLR